ncbi:MAG: hypothetical protein Q7T50_04525 [Candidatus Magasanikbacteria bacterium]|nr:hypothetical protein [Candidatus Magasanikbacteria bacterium]
MTPFETKEIIQKLHEINAVFKKEWDEKKDPKMAASYKLLNALIAGLKDEGKNEEEYDNDYVFTRILESLSFFADRYKITLRDVLIIGGFPQF